MIEKHSILSLLPYTEKSELVNRNQKLSDLYLIKSVIEMALMALDAFIDGKLYKFDAQVGENLCQIRAYKILQLKRAYSDTSHSESIMLKNLENLSQYKAHLEEEIVLWKGALTKTFGHDNALDNKEEMVRFLKRLNLDLELSEDVVFIVICFFLTHFNVRADEIPVAINLLLIAKELHISKYRAKRTMHKYQRLVCEIGCAFILKTARTVCVEPGNLNLLSQLSQVSDEDRQVLPCLIVSEVVFYHAIQHKQPIFFVIKRMDLSSNVTDVLYFVLQGDNNSQLVLVSPEEHLQDYCMVVSGVASCEKSMDLAEYVRLVLKETPLQLILANTASHPQYSGKRLEKYKNNPYLLFKNIPSTIKQNYEMRLAQMRDYAETEGCSKANPKRFLLKHIYASKVTDELTQLKAHNKNNYCAYNVNVMHLQ